MPAKDGLITKAQLTGAKVREIDLASRFGDNWDALRIIMGIMRPIRKSSGTRLVSYKTVLDGGLKGGDTVGEGEEIPLTKVKIEPVSYGDIVFHKFARSVSIESVNKYGAEIAVKKTDDAIITAITNKILGAFYDILKTGALTLTESNWQRALAMAKGSVLDKFADMDKDVTDIVGFANIMDASDYLGNKDITTQRAYGLNYIKDFLGYSTLFLLPEKYIPKGKVIATPVENIDLYYVDPSESDFAQLGLDYTVQGETNLIGVHVGGNYSRAAGDMTAIYGMTLWAEYLDGIAVITISGSPNDNDGENDGGGEDEGGEPEQQSLDAPNLNDMTKDELLDYAAENNVDVSNSDTKAQIIAAIRAAI